MELSYILPVYNEQNNIAQCLRSLLKQKIEGQIIVINDASTDNTDRIIQQFKRDIVYVTHKKRKGAAVCRNEGNQMATGDILCVCDAEIYYPKRSEAIHAFFKENPAIDVFYSSVHVRSSKNKEELYLQEAFEWDFKSKCPISHPSVAYRKSVIEKAQYHEKSMDTDLFEFFLLDLHKKKVKFGGCQDPLLMKIDGNSNRNTKVAKELKMDMYKKYGIKV